MCISLKRAMTVFQVWFASFQPEVTVVMTVAARCHGGRRHLRQGGDDRHKKFWTELLLVAAAFCGGINGDDGVWSRGTIPFSNDPAFDKPTGITTFDLSYFSSQIVCKCLSIDEDVVANATTVADVPRSNCDDNTPNGWSPSLFPLTSPLPTVRVSTYQESL